MALAAGFVAGCAEEVGDATEDDAGTPAADARADARSDAAPRDAGKDSTADATGGDAATDASGGDASTDASGGDAAIDAAKGDASDGGAGDASTDAAKGDASDGSAGDASSDAASDAKADAVADAEVDAGSDAAPVDAGSDAAPVDAGSDAAPVDAGSDAAPQGCGLVIQEIRTGIITASDNDFVELYNTCATPLSLDGYTLVWRRGANADPSRAAAADDGVYFLFPASFAVPGKGLVLLGGARYTAPKDGTLLINISDAQGAIGLRNAAGVLIDSVGYGSVDPANAFIEKRPAPAPPVPTSSDPQHVVNGNSIGRRGDGTDTGDNLADFQIYTTPTPGQTNP